MRFPRPADADRSPSRPAGFDEPLWPVYLALGLLGGFVAMLVAAESRFDDPRLLWNGYFRLSVLAGVLGAIAWRASWQDSRRVRRGIQLAAILSLLAHLAVAAALHGQRLAYLMDQPATITHDLDPPDRSSLGDYPFLDAPRVNDDFDVPLDLSAPSSAVSSSARQPRRPPEKMSLDSLPSPPADMPPANVIQKREREFPAPRRDELASLLSRRPEPAILPADEEIISPPSPIESPRERAESPAAGAGSPDRASTGSISAAPFSSRSSDVAAIEFLPPVFLPSKKEQIERAASTIVAPSPDGRPARSVLAAIAAPLGEVRVEPIPPDAAPAEPPVSGSQTPKNPSGENLALRGRRPGGTPVLVIAPDGSGGLGPELTASAGTPVRPSRRDSEVVHIESARAVDRRGVEFAPVDAHVRIPAEAFARRGTARRGARGDLGEPGERSETAIELGLEYLARHQRDGGGWSLQHSGEKALQGPRKTNAKPTGEGLLFQADTAATGLALLAFLGAGYDHFDGPYKQVIGDGLDYLVRHQRPDGDLYLRQNGNSDRSAWLYSHGIAAIAVCEAYGMTGDPALREPAQRAIDFIVSAQHPRLGGWRYAPGLSSDTSVSGWQLMALKSGELAGLKTPRETYERATRWLELAQAPSGKESQYVYNPNAVESQRHGRRPTPAMTAVGLLMRMYLGWNRDDPRMQEGAEHLLNHLPAQGTASQPLRDTYYWYYGTQVMFHMKGRYWQVWQERLHPLLAQRQIKSGELAGSWDPLRPIPDRWGPHGGRLYVTAMNLLSLEVYYRHLPIYDSAAQ